MGPEVGFIEADMDYTVAAEEAVHQARMIQGSQFRGQFRSSGQILIPPAGDPPLQEGQACGGLRREEDPEYAFLARREIFQQAFRQGP